MIRDSLSTEAPTETRTIAKSAGVRGRILVPNRRRCRRRSPPYSKKKLSSDRAKFPHSRLIKRNQETKSHTKYKKKKEIQAEQQQNFYNKTGDGLEEEAKAKETRETFCEFLFDEQTVLKLMKNEK